MKFITDPSSNAMINSFRLIFSTKKVLLYCLVMIGILTTPALAAERFLDNRDGTIVDRQTGLMWADKDNGKPINWENGWQYCKNFRDGGYSDWRMPKLAELQTLYNPLNGSKSDYSIIKLINTTAQSLWAAEARGFEAARFNFTYGRTYWLRKTYSGPTRVLPVRTFKSLSP